MKRYALSLIFCLLIASAAFAQTKPSLEGAWKITEWVEKGKTYSNLPGLFIFTKGYYSTVFVMSEQRPAVPRAKDPQNLTDADKIARFEQWRSFFAASGTYEIKGSTVSMRSLVAKSLWEMVRQTELAFEMEGPNTVLVIPNGEGAQNVGLRIKLTRLE